MSWNGYLFYFKNSSMKCLRNNKNNKNSSELNERMFIWVRSSSSNKRMICVRLSCFGEKEIKCKEIVL